MMVVYIKPYLVSIIIYYHQCYPNNTYLIFQQEDDRLGFLEFVMLNNSYLGEQLFTDDLQRILG